MRLSAKAAGMKAARQWSAERRPIAAEGHMPFEGHRTCAEVAGGYARCARTDCNEIRDRPCAYRLCGWERRA